LEYFGFPVNSLLILGILQPGFWENQEPMYVVLFFDLREYEKLLFLLELKPLGWCTFVKDSTGKYVGLLLCLKLCGKTLPYW
jgi:hypothetical protein